jgi:hypothetical protein
MWCGPTVQQGDDSLPVDGRERSSGGVPWHNIETACRWARYAFSESVGNSDPARSWRRTLKVCSVLVERLGHPARDQSGPPAKAAPARCCRAASARSARALAPAAVPHPRRRIPTVGLVGADEVLDADIEIVRFGADGQPAAAQVRRRAVERSHGNPHRGAQETAVAFAWEVQRQSLLAAVRTRALTA